MKDAHACKGREAAEVAMAEVIEAKDKRIAELEAEVDRLNEALREETARRIRFEGEAEEAQDEVRMLRGRWPKDPFRELR